MSEKELYQKVQSYIREYHMLKQKDHVVIGLSGGADSIALTDILYRLREKWELELTAVHVNHGIRGTEAEWDQSSAEEFCKNRGISFRSFRYEVPEISKKKKIGIEEAGRICRRDAFRQVVFEYPEQRCRIALAHNQNDLAETMLHHLARGTGLKGLCGILPVKEEIIRPVLCLTRKEIESYCEERKLSYVTDSSNLQDHYTRNRIRHHVLPVLEQEVNPEVVSHLAKTASQMAEAEEYLQKQARLLLEKQERRENSIFFGEDFFKEASILKSYTLMDAMEELAGKRKDLLAVHIQDILKLRERETSKRIYLPYGMTARRVYDGVLLEKSEAKQEMQEQEEIFLPLENGIRKYQTGFFETQVFPYNGEKIEEKKYTKWFDYDKIKNIPVVRSRRSGDFLIINQEGQRKKLKRYLIDEKIPSELRDTWPLLALESEILWVTGMRISEKYKVQKNTKKIFQVKYMRGERNERED